MKVLATTLIVATTLIGGAAVAGDPQAGKQKSAPCQACHGADGNGTGPQFPRLAGQYQDYLLQALMEYKDGERKNPIMAPFAHIGIELHRPNVHLPRCIAGRNPR